ncbi:MAG: hypothetical protein HQL95_11590 [Magnetococcales bacterium]|nr:hypothetical protein [Magnetococcales bacterium]
MITPPSTPPDSAAANLGQHFFIVSTAFLALTGGVMLAWGDKLHEQPLFPITVAAVHLYVLGVLTIGLIGLAQRWMPRWTGIPLPWPALNPWTLGSLAIGALTVFLGIGTTLHPWTLLVASAGVGIGCLFFLLQAWIMLLRTTRTGMVIGLLRLAMLSLTGVFFLGGVFLGEYSHGFLAYDRFAMVGTHLTWGIFGWAGALLVAMRLAVSRPDIDAIPKIQLWMAGLVLSWILVPVALFVPENDPRWLWPALLPGMISLVQLTRVAWPTRKSPPNHYIWIADICGALALLTALLWPIRPEPQLRLLFGVLILLGWTLSLMLGVLPFNRNDRLMESHWIIHLTAIVMTALGLLLPWPFVWQSGGWMLMISAILLLRVELTGEST